MFQYLEELVSQKEMSFPPELLKPMYELYLDISNMYVSRMASTQLQQSSNYSADHFLGRTIVHSKLIIDLRQGLQALPNEDRQ